MTFTYLSSTEVSNALRLKELLGRDKVSALRIGQHPLAAGFHALTRYIAGCALTAGERVDVADLVLTANTLFDMEPYWATHQRQLAADLLTARECPAITFELHVIKFVALPRARAVKWQRYLTGANDIRTVEPDVVIECKCLRAPNADSFFKWVRRAAMQRKGLGIPYVIAAGFNYVLDAETAGRLEAALRGGRRGWFSRHPEVSGAFVFLPHRIAPQRQSPLGFLLTPIREGSVVDIRNQNATNPLPPGF
jgi:hypothetical protein